MNALNYEPLLARIRERCAREYWYGPDMNDPDWFDKYDREGRIKDVYPEPRNNPFHPQRSAFAAPPLTEAQLQTIETRLDHPLPPFFRLLYTRIANGGFGPGYGLVDALSFTPETDWRPIELGACPQDGEMLQVRGEEWWRIPEGAWPSLCYEIVEWGCCNYSYLDVRTGRIYEGGIYGPDARFLMSLQAPSFEAFIERWASGKRTCQWG